MKNGFVSFLYHEFGIVQDIFKDKCTNKKLENPNLHVISANASKRRAEAFKISDSIVGGLLIYQFKTFLAYFETRLKGPARIQILT